MFLRDRYSAEIFIVSLVALSPDGLACQRTKPYHGITAVLKERFHCRERARRMAFALGHFMDTAR